MMAALRRLNPNEFPIVRSENSARSIVARLKFFANFRLGKMQKNFKFGTADFRFLG